MTYAERIREKLSAGLSPSLLEIKDDSARHAGHNPAAAAGGTHFTVTVVASAFVGKSPVARHRMIYQLLSQEMAEHVHALSINALTPDEMQP